MFCLYFTLVSEACTKYVSCVSGTLYSPVHSSRRAVRPMGLTLRFFEDLIHVFNAPSREKMFLHEKNQTNTNKTKPSRGEPIKNKK